MNWATTANHTPTQHRSPSAPVLVAAYVGIYETQKTPIASGHTVRNTYWLRVQSLPKRHQCVAAKCDRHEQAHRGVLYGVHWLLLHVDAQARQHLLLWHRACAGLIGTTSGKWCVETNTLHVIPEVKTGLYLTDARYSLPPLDILAYRDEYVFVHPKWRSSFIDYGKEGKVLSAFCFMKKPEDSNAAPLPATARPRQ